MEKMEDGQLLLTNRREVEALYVGAKASGQGRTLGADIIEATTLPVVGPNGETMTGPLKNPEYAIDPEAQTKIEEALKETVALNGLRGAFARVTGKKRAARKILATLAEETPATKTDTA